jgi:exonuclease SbcC
MRLTNFRSYADARFDFSSAGHATISGTNGAGKSTLVVDAPLWALCGKAHTDLDAVVGSHSDTAEVSLEIQDGGTAYMVKRSRVRGKTSALSVSRIEDGKAFPVASGVADAQNFIDKTLLHGRGYAELVASVYMVQGNHSAFTRASNADAKDIFSSLLALDMWVARAKRAREMRVKAEGEVDATARSISAMSGDDASRIPELEEQVAEYEGQQSLAQTRLTAAQEEEREAQRLVDSMQEVIKRAAAMQGKRAAVAENLRLVCDSRDERMRLRSACESAVAGFGEYDLADLQSAYESGLDAAEKADAWTREYGGIDKEMERVVADLESAKTEWKERVNEVATTKQDTMPCPECGQPLPEDSRKVVIERADARAESASKQVTLVEAMLKSLKSKQKKAGAYPRYNPTEHRSNSERYLAAKDVDEKRARIVTLSASISEDESLIKQREKDLAEIDAQATAGDGIEASTANERLTEAQTARRSAESAQRDCVSATESVKARVRSAQVALERAGGLLAQQKALEERVGLLKAAEAVFGREGVPASLMEAAIPRVTEVANELLDRMSNGALSLSILTEREKKDGSGGKGALDIIISDGVQERLFSTFSGGEGFRINFALRVALAQLVMERSGLALSMMVIDEPEGLDAEGRSHLASCLASISDRFETVILVSHHDDLKDALPDTILVTKDAQGSHIEQGGW